MNIPIFTKVTEAEALAYGLIDLDTVAFEAEFNAWLEEINLDAWLNDLEEAAAYRELIAGHDYGSN